MKRTMKLYAIYKNGEHRGNAAGTTPKLAIWHYCRAANLPVDYTIFKAKKAVEGKHYTGQENLWKVEICLDKYNS